LISPRKRRFGVENFNGQRVQEKRNKKPHPLLEIWGFLASTF
jgi:hypothetical protein